MNKAQRSSATSASSSVRATGILVGVIAVLYLARDILIPLAFAITLTLVLAPAVSWLERFRFSRVPAVFVVMTVSLMAAGWIGFVILGQLIEVVNELPQYQENIHKKLESMRTPGQGALGRAAASVKKLGEELSEPMPAEPPVLRGSASGPVSVKIVEAPQSEIRYLRDMAASFLKPLAEFGIVLIFTVFLLIEQNDLRNRLFRLVGLDKLNVMTQALDDATRRVSRYLMLQIMVNAGFGVFCGIGLYLLGVPYAALWAGFAAILRIVPYVGSLAAMLMPMVLSLAVSDGWEQPVVVLLLFVTAELATSNFIEPWLYGMHTGISSLALLITTVFWAVLWGPAGLILSTPLTVCVVVLGRYVPQFSFLHVLLGDATDLAPEARIYQRLLAMDDLEARAVASLYLKSSTLAQLYDRVMIPALSMAEQDRHKGALDPSREEFVFLSIKEMLAEFAEMTFKAENGNGQPAMSPVRMLCIPVNDDADEIAAAMLAQLLERAGVSAISFPVDASLQNSVGLVAPDADDVFCISALPPFAFARAIALNQQLRAQFPHTKVIIGVWGFAGDAERALLRFQTPHPDKIVRSLGEAVRFVVDASGRSIGHG